MLALSLRYECPDLIRFVDSSEVLMRGFSVAQYHNPAVVSQLIFTPQPLLLFIFVYGDSLPRRCHLRSALHYFIFHRIHACGFYLGAAPFGLTMRLGSRGAVEARGSLDLLSLI